jgi:CheY-like chemotaxis protein
MPIMDGYDCTTHLRNKGVTCPIIAVTANTMTNVKETCLKVGMNDFITKPFVISDIKRVIDKWLN